MKPPPVEDGDGRRNGGLTEDTIVHNAAREPEGYSTHPPPPKPHEKRDDSSRNCAVGVGVAV